MMSGYLKCFAGVAAVMWLAAGCVSYNGKKYYTDPGYTAFKGIYENQVNMFFRCAEMSAFFTEYLKVKDNSEASEALAYVYFGDRYADLCEDKLIIPGVAVLYNDNETDVEGRAVYTVVSYGCEYPFTYKSTVIEDTGERKVFGIECGDSSIKANGKISVDGRDVYMEEFESMFITEDLVRLSTGMSGGTVCIPRCDDDGFVYLPYSGELDVSVQGEGLSDAFTVRFGSERITLIRDGYTQEYPLFRNYSYYSIYK